MTDFVARFLGDTPAVGDDTFAIYYPYDQGLDVGFDTPDEAAEWYGDVLGSDALEAETAAGAYIVRIRIEKVRDL